MNTPKRSDSISTQITGIGANVFDTLILCSDFPMEDTKQKAKRIVRSGGGPCATALVAATKLGIKTSWLGVLADDPAGLFLWDDLIKYGVDTSCVEVVDGRDSFASIVLLNEKKQTRTCIFSRGNLPPLTLNERQLEEINRAKLLLVDGNEMEAAVIGAKKAREFGTKVLYDAGGLYPNVDQLLPLADILIPSENFALQYTRSATAEEAVTRLWNEFHSELVVITQGSSGGVLFDGKEIYYYPAFKVAVIDTNGAGDVFHGAFAAASVFGFPPMECCRFASAVSALKCTRLGSRDATPNMKEVNELLKTGE